MSDERENGFMDGYRAACRGILLRVASDLGYDNPESKAAALIAGCCDQTPAEAPDALTPMRLSLRAYGTAGGDDATGTVTVFVGAPIVLEAMMLHVDRPTMDTTITLGVQCKVALGGCDTELVVEDCDRGTGQCVNRLLTYQLVRLQYEYGVVALSGTDEALAVRGL